MTESVASLPTLGGKDHGVEEESKAISIPTLAIDPVEERKAVRRLDLCLVPIMTMFYLLSFLVSCLPLSHGSAGGSLTFSSYQDRANIGTVPLTVL